MSHDENSPNLHTYIDPELEARVVAWVLGEASAFEAAELERLIAERPELAIFKRRIEAVHGLVGEAARGDAQPLRLAPDRRQKLLETLGASKNLPPAEKEGTNVMAPRTPARARFLRRQAWMAAAACLTLCVLMAGVLVPKLGRMRESSYLAADRFEERPSQLLGNTELAGSERAFPTEPPPAASQPSALPESRAMGGKLGKESVSPKPPASPERLLDSMSLRAAGRIDADGRLEQNRMRADGPVGGGAGGAIVGAGVSAKTEFADLRQSSFGSFREYDESESKQKLDTPRSWIQSEAQSISGRLENESAVAPS